MKVAFTKLIQDKDFKLKMAASYKEYNYIMIKWSIYYQEHIKIINIYAANSEDPNYTKQILSLKGKLENNTVIRGEINTSPSGIDQPDSKSTRKCST